MCTTSKCWRTECWFSCEAQLNGSLPATRAKFLGGDDQYGVDVLEDLVRVARVE
jgi:hypothetical protein